LNIAIADSILTGIEAWDAAVDHKANPGMWQECRVRCPQCLL
jgi:hypothetical protein